MQVIIIVSLHPLYRKTF